MSYPLSFQCRLATAVIRRARLGVARWAIVPVGIMAILPGLAQAQAGHAQAGQVQVGQALGGERQNASAMLSSALIRLNRNPRDTEALIAAGNAALATGDTDAAVGFFTRADRLSPDNPHVEAGLAGAKVRAEDPFSAIPLFVEAEKHASAEKNGSISPELLGDRGLAYDLIGDNASAQHYYRQALANGAPAYVGAELSRRLALSLAIGGDRIGSETALASLLLKQDRAAWRTRVFALAILGYEEEAVATARSTMPADLALQMAPYLRYMRRLTPAQQAAAANLGHFPQASEIGHDDPRVAQYAKTVDRSRLASADHGLIPAGALLGRPVNKRSAAARPGRASSSNPAPPELLVSRETQTATLIPLAVARPSQHVPASVPTVSVPVVQPLSPRTPAPALAEQPRSATPVVQPVFNLAPGPRAPAPEALLSEKHAANHALPKARASFSDAFAAMAPAIVDAAPERGAVDLRKIKPARAIPPPPPPPPPPSPPAHPSRIWVEVGVGRNTSRIVFDWRRMLREQPEIFRGKKAFVSSWVRTNRILVGPFDTDKAATAFTEKLHKADHSSAFVWTSPAGQVVDPLDES